MTSAGEHARQLLSKSRDDLYVVKCLVSDGQAPHWTIGFHAQQAIEKALKAVLVGVGVEFPRTHNLSLLVELLVRHGMGNPPHAKHLAEFTPYGVVFRYDDVNDDDAPPVAASELQVRAADIVQWAEDRLLLQD